MVVDNLSALNLPFENVFSSLQELYFFCILFQFFAKKISLILLNFMIDICVKALLGGTLIY